MSRILLLSVAVLSQLLKNLFFIISILSIFYCKYENYISNHTAEGVYIG